MLAAIVNKKFPSARRVTQALVAIQISAAGMSGTESIELRVANQVVRTWANIGPGAGTRSFRMFEASVEGPVNISDIQVAFINDAPGRDVRVDRIVVDGRVFQTESPNTWSTGTWSWGACVPGYMATEWLHCNGSFRYSDLPAPPGPIPGAAGAHRINHQWNFSPLVWPIPAEKPVLLLGPATMNDPEPGTPRVRDVTYYGFESMFSEWFSYLDWHSRETVDWMLLPSGRYTTSDGSIWEIGTFSSASQAGQWKTVFFSKPFPRSPYVFLTIQTDNAARPLVVRPKEINRSQFKAALFAEERAGSPTGLNETIGYVAIYPAAASGAVTLGPSTFPYFIETPYVSSVPVTTSSDLTIVAAEEQTADAETTHVPERTRILRIGELAFTQDRQFNEADPFSYRIEKPPSGFELAAGFAIRQVLPGSQFRDPVDLEIAPDGRVFVAEEGGKIWIVENSVKRSTPYLDLGNELFRAFADQGALSAIALDPGFATNGFVYALYTAEVNGERFGRLSRFSHYLADPNRANPATQQIILGNTAANGLIKDVFHNVGDLQFGTDGTLLVSWGDTAGNSDTDASQFRSQQLDTPAGKIFRIDRASGLGLPSNPYYDGIASNWKSRVFAYGLRNGFRFQVHPAGGSTSPLIGLPGTLYIAEVGRSLSDEINIARRGENFGWPLYEGNSVYRSGNPIVHTPPVVALPHPSNRCIVGGVFCRNTTWPAQFHDAWLAADYMTGELRAWQHNAIHTQLTPLPLGTGIRGITAMAEDRTGGRVWFVGRGGDLLFSEEEGFSGLFYLEYSPQ